MEQLEQKDGAVEFFLMTAAMHVNWEERSTDILRDRLETVANAVNLKYTIGLNPFDVRLIWAKLRNLWETWVRATHYVPHMKVNPTTGEINIDDYAWDQLVRVVPESIVFQDKSMPYLNMVCTVFSKTPDWPVPEEHPNRLQNMSSSRAFKKERPSPKEVEKEETEACMSMVLKIVSLKSSAPHIRFCSSIFKDPVNRETFGNLPTNFLREAFVMKKYNEHVAHFV